MDPRTAKTRRRLQEALFALERERGVDEVSVSDIAARAGINRSTFYQHYSDKETLLADAIDLVREESGADLAGIALDSPEPPAALTAFLEHVDAHAELYRKAFTEPGYGVVLVRLRGHMRDAIRLLASDVPGVRPHEVPVDAVAAGITGLVLGVIGAWLGMDPRPPAADASRWIWRIVVGLPETR